MYPKPTAKVEGVPAEAPAAPEAEKQDALSPRFAALARKQKELRDLQKSIAAEKEAIKAKEQQYEQNYIPKDKIKSDPLSVFKEAGLSIDDLLTLAANQPQSSMMDSTVQQLQAQIKALEETTAKTQSSIQEQQQQAYEAAIEQIRNDVHSLVDSDPQFETIKESGSQDAVVELIKETFNASGEILSKEEAARQVEEYLLEEALKVASFKKVQAKLMPQAPEAEQKTPINAQRQPNQPIKTITNQATAGSVKPLSDKERRQRAISAFRGELK
jgi:hypothetical protein